MADATNHKKFIMSVDKTEAPDGQRAVENLKRLRYYPKLDSGSPPFLDTNKIETWKCSHVESCTHTYISGCLVIHHKTRVGFIYAGDFYNPSVYGADHAHGKGMDNMKTKYMFAIASAASPDVMVEGKWLCRENDATKQDNYNGNGVYNHGINETTVPDDSDLVFAQCGVEKLTLECEDHHRKNDLGELHVLFGNKVRVTALRVNAAETDPAKRSEIRCDFALYREKRGPLPKEETQHAVLVLSREGRTAVPEITKGWEKRENITLAGKNKKLKDETSGILVNVSEFVIDETWVLEKDEDEKKEPKRKKDDNKKEKADDAAVAKAEAEKSAALKKAHAAHQSTGEALNERGKGGSRDRQNKDVKNARAREKRANGKYDTARENLADAKMTAAAHDLERKGKKVFQTFKALIAMFDYDPLLVSVTSHGCSKGPGAKIKAYPPGEFSVDLWTLRDLPVKKTIESIQTVLKDIRGFLKNITGLREVAKGKKAPKAPSKDGNDDSFEVEFSFFRGMEGDKEVEPKVALVAEWKELLRDSEPPKETKGLKQWQVKRAWSLDIAVERLVGLKFSDKVSLLKCGFLVVVNVILNYFGIKAGPYFEFDIDLYIGSKGRFSFDEYGAFDGSGGGLAAGARLDIKLFIQAGKVAELGVEIVGTWKPVYKFEKNARGQVCLNGVPSTANIKGRVYVKYDFHGWKGDKSYEIFSWNIDVGGTSWPLMGESKA